MYLNFRQKSITSEVTLGEFLKKNREQKKISVEEISRKTKIRLSYLNALEANDYQNLPPEPYIRGMLKKYAEILGINYSQLLKLYEEEKKLIPPPIQKNLLPKTSLKTPRIIISPQTYVIAFIILGFLLVIGYIFSQLRHFTASPSLTINYPPDNLVVSAETIKIEGQTEPGNILLINDQNIPLKSDGHFKTTVSLQNGINFIKIIAKNRLNKETTLLRKVLAKIPPRVPPSSPPPTSLELTLQINPHTAWVYVEADDKQLYQGIMLPGTSQTFRANNYFVLSTRNAGSVEVIFNGKNLGKLGQEQQVIQGLRFDKNTKIEHFKSSATFNL